MATLLSIKVGAMMAKLVVSQLIIFWAFLSFASFAHAQALWQGTSYGMSTQEVSNVVRGARPPNKPGTLRDGATELLRLEGVQITTGFFDANFYFLRQRLVQVTLGLHTKPTFDSASRLFNSVAEALRMKYGREVGEHSQRGVLNQTEATWVSGRTNITVLCMSVGPEDAILNINYQVRVAVDADRL